MLDLTELRSRHEAIRLTEGSKDKIIEELISHAQRLDEALQCERNESQDQKKLVGLYRKDAEKCQVELAEKSRKEAALKFVSVLVDGDHMNFREKFVQNEQNGGRLAARALIEAVQNHIRKIKPDASPNIKYKIRVYANVAGLSKTHYDTGIVSSQDVLNSFIQGFNMEDTLCDFVDAGNGKECSDVKLGALFEHYFLDVHCQHIIFCGSADNGYARVLGSYRGSDRISLVEGPPFARELRELACDFETTSFPEVFRSKKMSRKVSFGGITATLIPTPPRTPTQNYASVAKRSFPISNNSSPTVNSLTRTIETSSLKLVVCKNANDERVDSPLQISTKGKIEALKQQKFCNQFHILGSCSWGGSCTHKHEPKLVEQDVVDLMWIARLSACPKGLQCDDESCVNGHRCPHRNCTGWGCKFPHDADTRIIGSN
ncbi:CCCH zinc finger DNA binding protein [Penicillium cf. viridicatum]|uniref:CCCH zinc finger DNA binding protein n=1 Tax=Penicillium cf. viridicatum TaxID=2972119 RepID=A0A9W9M7K6_9EURO|nr:CCCH zinc finger DNA binding protein [Penicillium cf. viridicatum]